MPLSPRSQAALSHAHPLLKTLVAACAADPRCPPFQVLEARRGRRVQEKAFAKGNSRARFGQSPHNYAVALALDIAPVPLDWNRLPPFEALGRFIMQKAASLKIPIVWGRNFRGLADYPHFELSNWRELATKTPLYKP
ncbi:MAG: M15 family metallopeptidase [Devosia sp.]